MSELDRYATALLNLEIAARRVVATAGMTCGVNRVEIAVTAYDDLKKATEFAREVLDRDA